VEALVGNSTYCLAVAQAKYSREIPVPILGSVEAKADAGSGKEARLSVEKRGEVLLNDVSFLGKVESLGVDDETSLQV
jgi:hypothetical protein